MHALSHARRTIAGDKAADAPHSLINLVCAMASVLGTHQSFLVSEALRTAADELEHSFVETGA